MLKKHSYRARYFCAWPLAFSAILLGAVLFQSWRASAQSDELAPNANLVIQGIPKVPAALAQQVKRYTGAYGLPLAGWHPSKRELWLKGISTASWVSRIETPGSQPKIWFYLQAGGIYDFYFRPQADYLVYNRDANGNEAFQFYLYGATDRKTVSLSDGTSRNTEPVWSNAGNRIVYSSSPPKGNGVSLSLIDPFDAKSNRLLVESTGNYLKAYDWSPDDKQIAYCEFVSNTVSKLWVLELESGNKRLLSQDNKSYFDSPKFSRDGKGLYVVTDQKSDFRRLAYYDLKARNFQYLSSDIKWDADEFQLSPDGKKIALVTNEDGISRMYLIEISSGKRTAVENLPLGIISDLKWHPNATDIAFNFKSPRTPNDVYSLDVSSAKIDRWAQSAMGGLDTEKLAQPEPIHWQSFDGKVISGFMFRPPASFTGKRPVIIDIHGGPEDQYRPNYGYEENYFINELGVVKIYPNVRGSTGYGKTFLDLDNKMRRDDSVKDLGALLDWIAKQPDLDADRVMLLGSSYGGYMSLAAAARYSDRIRGAISDSGPSNLATFVERTEGWRRDVRRAEFGDERDPKMRALMEKISPLNNAQKIKKPIFVIQGMNDPRVPVSEAETIVQAVKKNEVPVWFLLAKNEGHSFVVPANRDYRLYSIILFVKAYLLS